MSKNDIKQMIKMLQANPQALQALLDAGKGGRGSELRKHGGAQNPAEVQQVMKELLTTPDAPDARLVEWVGAVATAAAGALAA